MHELGQAIRALGRAPGYAAIIVLMLALGIGATATVFSVVNSVLLRPLPFPEPERLVMLWQHASGVGVEEDWLSPAQYFDIREQVGSLEELAILLGRNVTLVGDDAEPERIGALAASSSVFPLLGLRPELGRPLNLRDDEPGAPSVVLIGQRLFRQRFGGDPAVVGTTIVLDGQPLEVVGVLPETWLDADTVPTLLVVPRFDLLMSLPLADPQQTTYGSENFNVLARLAAGATRAQLESELHAAAARFTQDPESLGAGLEVGTEYRVDAILLIDQVVGSSRTPLLVLLAASTLLLAVACANAANLLLTRAATYRRETSVRRALGAPRRRLIRQALLECTVLSSAGGIIALVIAAQAMGVLRRAAPESVPRLGEVGLHGTVFVFVGCVCVVCTLAFGLGPALRIATVDPRETLHESAPPLRASPWQRSGSRRLVVVQVALSLVLAIATGLAVRTMYRLHAVDPGFRADGVLTYRLSLVGQRYADLDERVRFHDQLRQRVRGLAGVESASAGALVPLARYYSWTDFTVEGFNPDGDEGRIVADASVVAPGYFELLEIPVLVGRTFTDADGAASPVVVVDRSFAERFWGIEDAIGKWVDQDGVPRSTIVGVTEGIRHYGLDADPRLTVFYPYRVLPARTMFGVVRAAPGSGDGIADPASLAAPVAAAVRGLDPDLPIYDVRTMDRLVSSSLAHQRVVMVLLNVFSAIALAVAAFGLYGVLSLVVATQTQEIGIRKALGATRQDLYRHVFAGAGKVVGTGIVLGLVLALAGSRILARIVYGVGTGDPIALLVSIAIVTATALAASFVPARRAASVDPMVALKNA